VIEGSNDGSSWVEVDRRSNTRDLDGSSLTKTFPVCRSAEFQMIQLRQIGKNSAGNDVLAFSCLEIFGSLTE
jgi:hypothetical protein